MAGTENGRGIEKRLKIQEKALSNMADMQKKRDSELEEELRDIRSELKTLKLFFSRHIPEFKKQFPELRQKLK
jgi:hypothetical protein